MCRSRRLLNFGLISTAAFMAASTQLSADNVTTKFPNDAETLIIIGDGDEADDTISREELSFNTPMSDNTDNGATKNIDFMDSSKRLVIETAKGAEFLAGVNVTGGNGQIEFRGPVTLNLDAANNSLKVEQLYFVGSEEGEPVDTLTVNNGKLVLGAATKVNMDKNLKVVFGGGGGFNAAIPELRLGQDYATNLSFGANTVLEAATLETGPHGAVISGPVQVGKAAGSKADPLFTVGLAAENIIVGGETTVSDKLSGGGGTNFIFKKDVSIVLAQDAAGSELADNTKFQIHDDLLKEVILKETAVTAFKPFDTVKTNDPGLLNTFKLLAEGLALDDSNKAGIPGGGEMAYDPDSGYVVFASYGNREALSGVPGYGVPYVQALAAEGAHPTLAIAIKGTAKAADVSAELNTLMGNVPNAAMAAALSDNMGQVMGRLNSTLSTAMPGFAGPSGAENGLWIAPGYSLTKVSGSPKDGYGDLEIKNPGVTLGYDRWVNDRIRLGVFAAMNQPKAEGDNETVDTDHLQAGLYGQARLNYGLNVNMGLAYSRQSHDAERKIRSTLLAGYDQVVSSSFDSDALSAAVEVSRLYPLANNAFVRPTLGYSYAAVSMDGFTEKSNNQDNNLAQKVKDTDFTMHLLRLGAEGGWSNDVTTVTGRLFWVGNLGDTQPKTEAALITNDSMPFTLVGAEYDKNMVNIGLGVKYAPPQTRGLTLGLNYDALLGSNAKNHNLSLMVRYEF